MIPELKVEDYDPDNHIPEDILLIILAAIPYFERKRIEVLLIGASKAYLKGVEIAYKRLDKSFIQTDVEDDAYTFLKSYKSQINEGYTIIQGEKIYWLQNRTLAERQKIFDIINEGITGGKTPADIKKKFQDYFSTQKSQAELIAKSETAYVQAIGRDYTYKKEGVEKVMWTLGANPCGVCLPLGGQIFTWDDLPYQQPVHNHCSCDLDPVLD